jgi:hypothetical protein
MSPIMAVITAARASMVPALDWSSASTRAGSVLTESGSRQIS